MNRSICIAAATLSVVLLCGCRKDIQNTEAVRQGVLNYLSKRPGLLDMDVSIASVNFQKNEATADVHFQAKGNTSPNAGMNMQYVLERQGSQWVVKGRTGANASHGENGQPPSAAPQPGTSPGALDGMPAIPGAGGASGGGSVALPPGHPAIGSQALPPGHPAINPGQQK
ncbi:MAG TPA: hypothetical protein VME17_24870 [Bryobacteraceae bacterium]|nr:hypothetical protein [Bryobacteraceae bacterium]